MVFTLTTIDSFGTIDLSNYVFAIIWMSLEAVHIHIANLTVIL